MTHTKAMIYNPSVEAEDLYLYTVNTGEIYHRRITPTIKTLKSKASKGEYDPAKAVDAYYKIATEAAKMYCKELHEEQPWNVKFDVTARYTAAVDMEERYKENIFK